MGIFSKRKQGPSAEELFDIIFRYARDNDPEQQQVGREMLDTMAEAVPGIEEQFHDWIAREYPSVIGSDGKPEIWVHSTPGLVLPESADPRTDFGRISKAMRERMDSMVGRLDEVDGRWVASPLRVSRLTLPSDIRPTDGDRVSAHIQLQGLSLIRFDAYRGMALAAELDDKARTVTEFIAGFLGVKPWDIRVVLAYDAAGEPVHYIITGWPAMPVEKREKLTASIIGALGGNLGWKVTADDLSHRLVLTVGEPLTLPDSILADMAVQLDPSRQWELPYGVDALGREVAWDVTQDPMALFVGRTGTGKSQAIYPVVSAALARGWELAVCEVSKELGDYEELRPWVMDGGWGPTKHEASMVIQNLYAMKRSRMQAINAAGHKKLHSMSRAEQAAAGLKPILLVVDEAAALLAMPPTIKGIDKADPVAVAVAAEQADVALAGDAIRRISAELRAVGIHLLFATQRYDASLFQPAGGGLLRAQLGHKLVLGTMSSTTLSMSVENVDAAGGAYVIAHGAALTNDASADLAKPRPGRGIVETGTMTRPVQVRYAPLEEWVEALEARNLPKPGGSAPVDRTERAGDVREVDWDPFAAAGFDTPTDAPVVDSGFTLDDSEANPFGV